MVLQQSGTREQKKTNFKSDDDIRRLQGFVIDVSSNVGANTEFEIPHDLGYLATNVEVLVYDGQTDAYISVKPSGTAWTRNSVFLKCNTANCTMRLRIT